MQNNHVGSLILDVFKSNSEKEFLKSYNRDHTYTGQQAAEATYKIARCLMAEGCQVGDRVAIYSQNYPEWTLIDLACIHAKTVSVPIFATSNAGQTEYILKDSGSKIVFVGDQPQYDEIMKTDLKDDIRIIVLNDEVKLQTPNSILYKDWLEKYENTELNSELEKRTQSIQEQDLLTLIYTSGTTGKPKGVKLHHKQFNALIKNHNIVYDFKPEYTSITFLPLSHVFERGWCYIILANGMTNIYLNDPKVIAKAITEVKPDTFCAVPRLYEKIYATIMDNVHQQSVVKQKMFHWAVDIGKKHLLYIQDHKKVPTALALKYKLAEKLVFNKIRNQLGGNLKICPCGGAYMPDDLVTFFRGIGFPLLVGYGLTESTATVTSFTEENYKVGTVGKPLVNVQVKIGENNEILVKGDTITSGYFNLDEESEEIFTSDGWLKTGDAGHLDEDGYLVITDRIKQLIKTANGKYIAPQLVEGHLTQSPFISQAMVVGEGKPYASALITLDKETVVRWAKNRKITYNSYEELTKNDLLRQSIAKSVKKKQAKLSDYEKAKKFKILNREFSMEDDELTPTLKFKRKTILEKYADDIASMYRKA
ncbi:MAG: AMP-dependent synthetase/ligase [Weeksellaceae bacterium]